LIGHINVKCLFIFKTIAGFLYNYLLLGLMKHTWKITGILVVLFLFTQVIGLTVINNYIDVEQIVKQETVIEDGKEVIKEVIVEEQVFEELPYGIERPELKEKTSYLSILLAIIIATSLALILLKFQAMRLWKLWFFLSVFFTLMIAFNAFIPQLWALVLALVFAGLKTFRNSVIIHNFSELFIYGGLAVIFVPVINVLAIVVILLIISIYDYIAVWKTKHMIKMAKFQAKLKLFAGLMIPYGRKSAILGGGDLGFPLLFSGVIFKSYGWGALITVLTSTLALGYLLVKSEKGKYYPAMPFLTVGILIGFIVVKLVL
jgi:presenilin-like A22 family membrane protease|tara:strand:- start:41944 stop:42894 length:951 start_codon:yes stop_codon:yes gene_type:complete